MAGNSDEIQAGQAGGVRNAKERADVVKAAYLIKQYRNGQARNAEIRAGGGRSGIRKPFFLAAHLALDRFERRSRNSPRGTPRSMNTTNIGMALWPEISRQRVTTSAAMVMPMMDQKVWIGVVWFIPCESRIIAQTPVEPKPPAPRAVGVSAGSIFHSTAAYDAMTSWAMRSPGRMWISCRP